MTLEQIKILDVVRALGGPEPKGKRIPAWWRGGDGLNVHIDVDRGSWHDYVTDTGGYALGLVMIATRCTKLEALLWLEQNCGLDPRRPLSPQEKREYALRAAGTECIAIRLADFARGLELIAEKTVMELHGAMVATGIDAPETLQLLPDPSDE